VLPVSCGPLYLTAWAVTVPLPLSVRTSEKDPAPYYWHEYFTLVADPASLRVDLELCAVVRSPPHRPVRP
jgi:hypothetical protein